ncbi:Fanconi anemia group F protein [Arapaima gigas]
MTWFVITLEVLLSCVWWRTDGTVSRVSCTHMETVLRDLEAVVQLLAAARTHFVSCWDATAVRRALQWARYCERLHARFHSDLEVRHALEQLLQEVGRCLGGQVLTLPELAQCEGLLIQSLLRNPAVPHEVTKELLGMGTGTCCAGQMACQHSALPYLEELIQYKAAAQLLSHPLQSILGPAAPMDPETQIQGKMVRQRLDSLLQESDPEWRSQDFLDSILRDCGEDRCFSLMLAAAALSAPPGSDGGRKDVVGIIVDWLLGNRSQLLRFCRDIPSALLVDLAERSSSFREAYCSVLEDWGHSLRYNVLEALWVPDSDCAVSFDTLVDRWQSLLRSPSLREGSERLLLEMKLADGDFDVTGLSVWSDVLAWLRK